nr:carbohydrate-binding protein [Spirochaetaceae bacterium]
VACVHNVYFLEYEIAVASNGSYQVTFQTAAWVNDTKFSVYIDGQYATTITMPYTGAYQAWNTVSQNILLSSGAHKLKIIAETSGWNINWMNFVM